jgi:primosomal protein N'
MNILTVIPLKKTPFREELSYFSMLDIKIGSIVKIKIQNRELLGLVIDTKKAQEVKGEVKKLDFKIKKVLESKEISIFKDSYLESILKTSEYFLTNKNTLATYLIPNILKENYDEISKFYSQKEKEIKIKNIKSEKLLFQDKE